MYLPTKRSAKDKLNDAYVMFLCLCFLFLVFFIKSYIVGIHLNCIDKSMQQHKWVPTTYAFIKYPGCNLKTTEKAGHSHVYQNQGLQ